MALPGLVPTLLIGSAAQALSVTYVTYFTRSSSSNLPVTLGTATIGQPDAKRLVVVALAWSRSAGTSGDPIITIGGVAATRILSSGASGAVNVAMYVAVVPTGTTADVVSNFQWGNHSRQTAFVYTINGAASATPTASTTSESTGTSVTATMSPAAATVTVAAAARNTATTGNTWSNVTEDVDIDAGDTSQHTSAHGSGSLSNPACTGTGSVAQAIAAASWSS